MRFERILENSYHGLIKENETFVEITPLIKVDETKICGFHIIKKNKEIPFQLLLLLDYATAIIPSWPETCFGTISVVPSCYHFIAAPTYELAKHDENFPITNIPLAAYSISGRKAVR
uniref:Uncharacterized protein n=1 Tax=Anopheles culicifacies TaxID=139723 RepID=A0A182MBC4_9DIPT